MLSAPGFDFGKIALGAPLSLQPKLAIGAAGDAYEQEADRVAEQVMSAAPQRVQRSCAACEGERQSAKTTPNRLEYEALRLHDEEEAAAPQPAAPAKPEVRRKPASSPHQPAFASAPEAVHRTIGSGGRPLESGARSFMESRFGHDFGAVRVHSDAGAERAAASVQARAFTVGRDVVFGAGQYEPASEAGRRLLAHELTHVVQQGGAGPLGRSASPQVQRMPIARLPMQIQRAIHTSVSPGAKPSVALDGCTWGITQPESVKEWVFAVKEGANWKADPTALHGNYSEQTRLLPGVHEVTGPGKGGNTTSTNYCEQVQELNALGVCPDGHWYMQSAVVAHENVHAAHLAPALTAAATYIQNDFNAVTVPDAKGMTATSALSELRKQPGYATAQGKMEDHWDLQYGMRLRFTNPGGDHATDGPTEKAEHRVVDPKIAKICAEAKANKWPTCASCP
jgi:hypothetical protein